MIKLYICGDSTAASYSPEDTLIVGWGQLLSQYLLNVTVENRAMAGRSTKTFLAEGRLDKIEKEISTGDLLLIQFAHNDEGEKPERHTEAGSEYRDNLSRFIRTAEKHHAVPVLVTPICIRFWENGILQPTHGEYLQTMREIARSEDVPLIDLYEDSFRIVSEMGEENSKRLYMHLKPEDDPRYPEGLADDTHTRYEGADLYARFMAGDLLSKNLI